MSEQTQQASSSTDQTSGIWQRLRRHKVVEWSVAYIALAYGIQHAVALTTEALDWPHAVERLSMILLALGIPVVLTIAWYHGAKANRRISGPELTIITILIAIGSILFYVFVRMPEQIPNRSVATRAPASLAATSQPMPSSVPAGNVLAVLPFVNVSGDPSQKYFSDGMTDEIMAALAKVSSLRVVARESAFQFEGKNEDVRAIGKELGARYLIEGSVRRAGEEVRITAQLVRTDNGVSLWTDSYDRELKDVFAVQEDIARAIATALRVPLGLKADEQLVSNRTSDTAAYEDYLRALALYRARDIKNVIALLEPMVKRDPTYAPAWALLAEACVLEPLYVFGLSDRDGDLRPKAQSAYAEAETAARHAIGLDRKYAPGYAALGFLEDARAHWAEADDDFRNALALDPTDPDTTHLYASSLVTEGRVGQALKMRITLHSLEPFVPIYNVVTAFTMQLGGDVNGAASILEKIPTDGTVGAQRDDYLAFAYASQGRYALAAQTLLAISPDQVLYPMPAVRQAADIIVKAPAKYSVAGSTPVSQTGLGWVYGFVGAPDRIFDFAEHLAKAGIFAPVTTLNSIWGPPFSAMRKSEHFKGFARKVGLVDYWRAKGWPDLCHPVGPDDFACD